MPLNQLDASSLHDAESDLSDLLDFEKAMMDDACAAAQGNSEAWIEPQADEMGDTYSCGELDEFSTWEEDLPQYWGDLNKVCACTLGPEPHPRHDVFCPLLYYYHHAVVCEQYVDVFECNCQRAVMFYMSMTNPFTAMCRARRAEELIEIWGEGEDE